MKNLILILGLVVGMMTTQAQSLSTFDDAGKANLNAYGWTSISSGSEQMQIGNLSVAFVAEQARMTREVEVQNHISKNSYVSLSGEIVKGVLKNSDGKTIGMARFSHVGTSMAGNAIIGDDTYKFRPDKDGKYYWELEAPLQCGSDDEHHNCDVDHQDQTHGAKELHQNDDVLSLRSPMDCTSESIQDVAFVTDDLMTEYGDDLDAILAQIAISDSWATDVMNDSGFPDIQFFQESVHVVDFAETGSTYGNLQGFNDSLYANPPGLIASIMQGATTFVTALYSVGGGGRLEQHPLEFIQ